MIVSVKITKDSPGQQGKFTTDCYRKFVSGYWFYSGIILSPCRKFFDFFISGLVASIKLLLRRTFIRLEVYSTIFISSGESHVGFCV